MEPNRPIFMSTALKPFSVAAIASAEVADVREVINYYRQFENPLAQFRENQRKLLEQMHEQEQADQAASRQKVKKWTPSFLGGK